MRVSLCTSTAIGKANSSAAQAPTRKTGLRPKRSERPPVIGTSSTPRNEPTMIPLRAHCFGSSRLVTTKASR